MGAMGKKTGTVYIRPGIVDCRNKAAFDWYG
jgi:hypothetical protein